MTNAWGFDIPLVPDVLRMPEVRPILRDATDRMLAAVGESDAQKRDVLDVLFSDRPISDLLKLEKSLHERISHGRAEEQKLSLAMRHRAAVIYGQISKYFIGESMADIGCGHGLVAWQARNHFEDILLLDVADYRDPEVLLLFRLFAQGHTPPFGRSFDSTLLITVLHHAENPADLLNAVWAHTRKRLIIIESVFGIENNSSPSPLVDLDQDTQLCYAVYCDWFYNRVLNQNVSVPYNFNTPANWRRVFSQLPARVAFEENLGVDLDIVPEHHHLYVLTR